MVSMLPDNFHLFSPAGVAVSAGIFIALVTLYALGTAIYNIWFHPLAHIPGPLLAQASGIPYTLRIRNGKILPWLQTLHAQYGDAVRVNPTDVSFISGETAWQDIYGFRTGKHKTGPYDKDRSWFPPPINGTYHIINANEAAHSRMRRNLSHAFSDKALRDQESLIQSFVDLLIHRLNEQVQDGVAAVDIMRWYNFTTFDIIADLAFGEPLYCLRDKDYHPWVNMVFDAAKSIGLVATKSQYPIFDTYDRIKGMFKDTTFIDRRRADFWGLAKEKVSRRLEKEGSERPDFMSYIIKNQGSEGKALTRMEMDSNAVIFLVAGSETTATALSGTTYLLLKHPEMYSKLVREVRSRFTSQSDITIDEVNKLDYMIACLQEGLRCYPPVPTGFPRVVPPGGDNISGYYVPEGMSVYVSQHATNRSPRNWTDPDAYVPERWLGDQRYKGDNQAAMNAFSFGPRNCLGKNLAYAEMRLIIAKILFNFDLELVDKETDWLKDQKCFTLWEKPALMVKLHPVKR